MTLASATSWRWQPPGAVRAPRTVVSVLIICVAASVALLRVGSGGLRGVVWAEDGAVFLSDAHARGPWRSILSPYAGYLHVAPRTIVALIDYLPIGWQGVAVNVAAAAVQAGIACFAFHVVRANARGVLAPGAVALAVVLAPVGVETTVNLANLQWYLLFAGAIAPFWTPATRVGEVASVLVVLAVTMSCPFGGIALVASAAVWLLSRTRFAGVMTVSAAFGVFVQALGVLQAPSRGASVDHSFSPVGLVHGYTVRVLGDGVFGLHFHDLGRASVAWWPGLAVLAGGCVLAALAVRRRGWPVLAIPLALMAESAVAFVAPVVLSAVDWRNAVASPRYYLAPALLMVPAIGLLVGQLTTGENVSGTAHRTPGAAGDWAARAVVGVALGSLLLGWVTSYSLPAQGRSHGPAWAEGLRTAASMCARGVTRQSSHGPLSAVPIAPAGWAALVPCRELRGS